MASNSGSNKNFLILVGVLAVTAVAAGAYFMMSGDGEADSGPALAQERAPRPPRKPKKKREAKKPETRSRDRSVTASEDSGRQRPGASNTRQVNDDSSRPKGPESKRPVRAPKKRKDKNSKKEKEEEKPPGSFRDPGIS